jgi:hypothetical protein
MRKHMGAAKVRGIRGKKKGMGKKMGFRRKNKVIFRVAAWAGYSAEPGGVMGGVLRAREGEFGGAGITLSIDHFDVGLPA